MAEEVLIQVWCDPCLKTDGTRNPGKVYRQGDRRVDLCEEHARPVEEAARILKEYGRPDQASNGHQRPSKRPSKAPEDLEGMLACPDCGQAYKGPQGLGAHRRSVHGIVGQYSRDRAST